MGDGNGYELLFNHLSDEGIRDRPDLHAVPWFIDCIVNHNSYMRNNAFLSGREITVVEE